ncbi:hypothetical protein [Streptomyces sp. NBC_01294]|uniref:hypothetical protein n=1 Tax=Streptomyces sp. NBC_01294 TaxID=2903815 RepID=UPI002DDBB918|nr:hypothetical protein [Streptomyces sp. NBC_01294]WRZ55089.1 hypothetical protein OG534_00225 [Streptomyces sp. NBC_01294]
MEQVVGVQGGDEEGAVVAVLGEPVGDAADFVSRIAAAGEEPAQVGLEVAGEDTTVMVSGGIEVEFRIGVLGQIVAQRRQGVPPLPGADHDAATGGLRTGVGGGEGQEEPVDHGGGIVGLVQSVKDHEYVAASAQCGHELSRVCLFSAGRAV